MSRGRWSTDTVDARGAWMTQRITSNLRNPGLQKPCSWDIEDGFLDPWRKRKDLFEGTTKLRKAPRRRSGTEIDMMLKNWKKCPPPGKINSKRKAPEPLLKVWKTRSVFWDLPYWNILGVPNSLDVMHITKNVCESLFATLLNMPEKTKDGRKQGQTFYHWASGSSFTQTALM